MPRLTEAEYETLEDEITRNPPDVDPAKSRRPSVYDGGGRFFCRVTPRQGEAYDTRESYSYTGGT
jgi:hypothetical protein